MTSSTEGSGRSRIDVFDGLRGVAILLVVLSHTSWIGWPHVRGEGNLVTRAAMENGNYAVSFFFVVGAFLYTRGLLARAASHEGLHPGVVLLRRFLRLTPSVVVLLMAAWVVRAVEPTPTYKGLDLGDSALAIVTYTWNWYVKDNPLVARPDLGHLWYLSVDMQVFVLVLMLVFLFRHRRGWLLTILVGLLVMVLAWRTHVYQTEGLYQALLRTNARMDAPLTGAIAAVILPYLGALRPWSNWLTVGGLAALPVIALFTVDDVNFFRLWGDLEDLALAAFVLGCSLGPVPRAVRAVLANRPLAYLGRRSLSLYIWHFPIFMYLHHHTESWSWQTRTIVAVTLTVACSLVNDLVIERAVSRGLASSTWRRLDHGIPAFLMALVGAASAPAGRAAGGNATGQSLPGSQAGPFAGHSVLDPATMDDVDDRAALGLNESDDAVDRPS